MHKTKYAAGMRIRFLNDLTAEPTGEHPSLIYAKKGDGGRITKVGGCCEGYMVKWDNWQSAAFGCEEKDFVLESRYKDEHKDGKIVLNFLKWLKNDPTDPTLQDIEIYFSHMIGATGKVDGEVKRKLIKEWLEDRAFENYLDSLQG